MGRMRGMGGGFVRAGGELSETSLHSEGQQLTFLGEGYAPPPLAETGFKPVPTGPAKMPPAGPSAMGYARVGDILRRADTKRTDQTETEIPVTCRTAKAKGKESDGRVPRGNQEVSAGPPKGALGKADEGSNQTQRETRLGGLAKRMSSRHHLHACTALGLTGKLIRTEEGSSITALAGLYRLFSWEQELLRPRMFGKTSGRTCARITAERLCSLGT